MSTATDEDTFDTDDDAAYFAEMQRRSAARSVGAGATAAESQPVIVHGAHGDRSVVYVARPRLAPPTPRSFFVDPKTCRLLAGAYPRDQVEVDALLASGVGMFVNLTDDASYTDYVGDRAIVLQVAIAPQGVAPDQTLVDLCRDIVAATRGDEACTVYMHSELGCGRISSLCSLLVAGIESTPACHTIDLVQAMRQMQRSDTEDAFVPMPESDLQRRQIARLLKGRVDDDDESSDTDEEPGEAEQGSRRKAKFGARAAKDRRVQLRDATMSQQAVWLSRAQALADQRRQARTVVPTS